MRNVILFSPGQATLNIGDEIIAEACSDTLNEILTHKQYVTISTHLPISNRYLKYIKDPEFKFVLGSNLLMSNMYGYFRQWDIKIWNKSVLRNTILLGVGWHQYSKNANFYTKNLYKSIFSKEYIHSVRDEYTKEKLEQAGIKNVLNTGCPTLWKLTKEHCSRIPTNKAKQVVFTITDYSKNPKSDTEFIKILKSNYDNIYFWPQRKW